MSIACPPEEVRERQRELAEAIIDNMKAHLLKRADRWPADWDGHELRELLADAFERERTSLMREARSKRKSRYRDYRNAVVIDDLY